MMILNVVMSMSNGFFKSHHISKDLTFGINYISINLVQVLFIN